MADDPILLGTIAQELLDAAVEGLEDAGLDLPQRVFREVGGVVAPVELDGCTDQLTVVVPHVQPALTTDIEQRRAGWAPAATLWQARFEITLLRCHPLNESGIPDPAETDAEAELHLMDGWQLLRSMSYKWHHKELVPSYPMDHENTIWGTLDNIAPQGGIRGWSLKFTVSVHDQYAPELDGPQGA